MNTEEREIPATVTDNQASSATIAELASDWLATKGSRARTLTQLAFAEARLAAISVALMTFLGMLAAIFIFAAWGLGIAGLVIGLAGAGIPLWVLITGLAFAHGLIAYALWRVTMRLGENVEFRATRRQVVSLGRAES